MGISDVCFSKVTKSWAAKPIKEQKIMAMFSELVDQTVKAVIEKTTFEEKENNKFPKILHQSLNPIKKILLDRNQRSRFSVKYLIEYFMYKCKKSKKM